MRVIRFPGADAREPAGLAAGERLDALLAGELAGPEGESLRLLREDVRALAPPMSAQFEVELQARVAEWAAAAGVRRARSSLNERLRAWLGVSPARRLASGGAAVAVVIALVAVAVAGSWFGSRPGITPHTYNPPTAVSSRPEQATSSDGSAPQKSAKHAAQTLPEAVARANGAAPPGTIRSEAHGTRTPGASSAATRAEPQTAYFGPAVSSPSAPGHLQQLAASVTLATGAGGVQQAAEAAARLAVSDGGFVEQSHVQVRGAGGEAQLRLQVPSGKLASAIAALGRIAPERAVNQESEDITSAYDGAKRRLGDAEAVRRALLRALAAATSEGQIDSLRERLAQNRAQIAEYRSQVKAEAHRAATSELEVTITSTKGTATGRSTLGQGLHDAGHVLAVAGAVALIVLAVLVPLGLAALALDALRRAWLRRRRESALDT